jgi:hypothetical protein
MSKNALKTVCFYAVYAVWPCSFLFLLLYSFATQRLSRAALFNVVVVIFLAFYVTFGLLYPQHQDLHLHSLAEDLLKVAPAGLAGAVGMVRKAPLPSNHLNVLGAGGKSWFAEDLLGLRGLSEWYENFFCHFHCVYVLGAGGEFLVRGGSAGLAGAVGMM